MEQPQATKVEPESGLSTLLPKSLKPCYRNALGIIVSLLAVLTLVTPLYRADVQGRVGLLLLLTAMLEIAHGFRRATPSAQRAAWISGGVTLVMGVLLINAPFVAASALMLFLAGWFAIDGLRYLFGAFRRRSQERTRWVWILAGAGNLLVAGLILAVRGPTLAWIVAIAAALRILGHLVLPVLFYVVLPMAICGFGGSRMKDPNMGAYSAGLGAVVLGAVLGGIFGSFIRKGEKAESIL